MSEKEIHCPKCESEYTYFDGHYQVCSMCGEEFNPLATDISDEKVYKDANGNILNNGDSVILTKDLKVKGSSIVIKKGTKVKNIRLVDSDHDVDCKIDGQQFSLKSEFLKKVN